MTSARPQGGQSHSERAIVQVIREPEENNTTRVLPPLQVHTDTPQKKSVYFYNNSFVLSGVPAVVASRELLFEKASAFVRQNSECVGACLLNQVTCKQE